jgi:uncharacterized protein YjbJ (UPF0337 family)
MNWDQIEGKWKQFMGSARERWGKFTADDWDQIAGKRDKLIGKLQEKYGWSREQAEKDLGEWEQGNERGRTTSGKS